MKNFIILVVCSFFTHTTLSQVPPDKQKHFVAGAAIAGFTYTATYMETHNHKKAMLYSILSSFVVGALKELSDMKDPNNHFDGKDLLATGLGGITVGVTVNLFHSKNRSNQNTQVGVHRY